jgi:hypothetical protein
VKLGGNLEDISPERDLPSQTDMVINDSNPARPAKGKGPFLSITKRKIETKAGKKAHSRGSSHLKEVSTKPTNMVINEIRILRDLLRQKTYVSKAGKETQTSPVPAYPPSGDRPSHLESEVSRVCLVI